MNTNKKPLSIVERAKKTFVGKIVCRMMGEEKGAVMMEYVIVAVMIAAAVAMGAWFFGKDILNMFGVAGAAATGDNSAAETQVGNARTGAAAGHNSGTTHAKRFVASGDETTGDVTAQGNAGNTEN